MNQQIPRHLTNHNTYSLLMTSPPGKLGTVPVNMLLPKSLQPSSHEYVVTLCGEIQVHVGQCINWGKLVDMNVVIATMRAASVPMQLPLQEYVWYTVQDCSRCQQYDVTYMSPAEPKNRLSGIVPVNWLFLRKLHMLLVRMEDASRATLSCKLHNACPPDQVHTGRTCDSQIFYPCVGYMSNIRRNCAAKKSII